MSCHHTVCVMAMYGRIVLIRNATNLRLYYFLYFIYHIERLGSGWWRSNPFGDLFTEACSNSADRCNWTTAVQLWCQTAATAMPWVHLCEYSSYILFIILSSLSMCMSRARSVKQWRQLRGAGGPSPPRFPKWYIFWKFHRFYWFNVQYVQAYQDLVHFSTWIDFNIESDDTGFSAWLRKKIVFLRHKKFCPPRNLWIGATGVKQWFVIAAGEHQHYDYFCEYRAPCVWLHDCVTRVRAVLYRALYGALMCCQFASPKVASATFLSSLVLALIVCQHQCCVQVFVAVT